MNKLAKLLSGKVYRQISQKTNFRIVTNALVVITFCAANNASGMAIDIPWNVSLTPTANYGTADYRATGKLKWDEHLWGVIDAGYVEAGLLLQSQHNQQYSINLPFTIHIEAPDTVKPGQVVPLKTSVELNGGSFGVNSQFSYDTSFVLKWNDVPGAGSGGGEYCCFDADPSLNGLLVHNMPFYVQTLYAD